MNLQIIGPPTSGKSTFIKEFLIDYPLFHWLDIASYNTESSSWLNAESQLLEQLSTNPDDSFLIESVSGFYDINSINIKFTCSINDMKERHLKRKRPLTNYDLDYYSSLEELSVKPILIINTSILRTYGEILAELKPIIFKDN